jgi:hypothetical protein
MYDVDLAGKILRAGAGIVNIAKIRILLLGF